ncbi:hypothetical protein WAI453_011538 [Rhynchosporium graminicola]
MSLAKFCHGPERPFLDVPVISPGKYHELMMVPSIIFLIVLYVILRGSTWRSLPPKGYGRAMSGLLFGSPHTAEHGIWDLRGQKESGEPNTTPATSCFSTLAHR